MDNRDNKTIFNMPDDEISKWLKALSRYVIVVELVAIGACLPIIVREKYIILTAVTVLMILDIVFMRFCDERKSRFWIIIRRIQTAIALVGIAVVVISLITDISTIVKIAAYFLLGWMWGHSAICFFEYRKAEFVPALRFVGAFTIIVTVIVFFLVKQWLLKMGISFE